MKATKTCVAATRFQYDYLNDDITDDGQIDYTLTNKIIPSATIAMFSKLKYVTAPTLDDIREVWNSQYLDGFVVDSKSFDGLIGNFPIGFLIWQTDMKAEKKRPISKVKTEILNKKSKPIGDKVFYAASNHELLTNWIDRPKTNKQEVVPLKNAMVPATATKDLRGTKWSDNAIGYLLSGGYDLQHAGIHAGLFSSGYGSARGYFINAENIWKIAILFTLRKIIKPTWLNDRDQFLQPTQPLSEEFKTDCLIWMLFNGSNLTASQRVRMERQAMEHRKSFYTFQ